MTSLNPFLLAYVHVVEGETGGPRYTIPFDYSALHGCFDGFWMVNNGYDRNMAIEAITSGRADLVSFGRLFIANPDLVERLRENAPLNPLMGQETFYGGGAPAIPTILPSNRTAPRQTPANRCRPEELAAATQTSLARSLAPTG